MLLFPYLSRSASSIPPVVSIPHLSLQHCLRTLPSPALSTAIDDAFGPLDDLVRQQMQATLEAGDYDDGGAKGESGGGQSRAEVDEDAELEKALALSLERVEAENEVE